MPRVFFTARNARNAGVKATVSLKTVLRVKNAPYDEHRDLAADGIEDKESNMHKVVKARGGLLWKPVLIVFTVSVTLAITAMALSGVFATS
jgi:hypothetical protein